jgi:hypothetical protein
MKTHKISVHLSDKVDLEHTFDAVWAALCHSDNVTQEETDLVLQMITNLSKEKEWDEFLTKQQLEKK